MAVEGNVCIAGRQGLGGFLQQVIPLCCSPVGLIWLWMSARMLTSPGNPCCMFECCIVPPSVVWAKLSHNLTAVT